MFFKKKKKTIAEKLSAGGYTGTVSLNEPMVQHCSFRCGGAAECFAQPASQDELASLLRALSVNPDIPCTVLGNGTNTLFADGVYPGLVIKIGSFFSDIDILGCAVHAGAGALLSQVAKAASADGLAGLEFACGIPGSIGGAIYMNAGAYEGDIASVLKSVTVMHADGTVEELPAASLDLSYRHSALMETGDLVLSADFELTKGDQGEIDAKIADFTERRTAKQPLSYPSAGSFFKRPSGHFAGALIEKNGLKGLAVGGAQVSSLHAGFIINTGRATASDVIDLMKIIQETVLAADGVLLEPEVRIIGN